MKKFGLAVLGCAVVVAACGGEVNDAGGNMQTASTVGPNGPQDPNAPSANIPPAPGAHLPGLTPPQEPQRPQDPPSQVRLNIPSGEVCIVASHGRTAFVPLDGSPPTEGPNTFSATMGNASLGLHAGALYMCSGTVTRVSLVDGYAESMDVPCLAVTANHGGIWVLDGMGSGVAHYANDAALRANEPDATGPGAAASRIAVRGESDELAFAWHATSEILVGKASETPKAVTLAGYDGWITGLDRMEDGRFVIGTWFTENELRVYAADGTFLKSVSLAGTISMPDGIMCGDGAKMAEEAAAGPAQGPRRVSASIAGTCGGKSSNYTATVEGANEVHVIGVYEGQYEGPTHGPCWDGPNPPMPEIPPCPPVRPRGKISVHVKATAKPVVLVLSSYEPVDYTLTVDAQAKIAKVVTQGYYENAIAGVPAGTPIEKAIGSSAHGWEPEHNTGGSNFAAFIADIRKREGAESSFHGCYAGDHFEVPFR